MFSRSKLTLTRLPLGLAVAVIASTQAGAGGTRFPDESDMNRDIDQNANVNPSPDTPAQSRADRRKMAAGTSVNPEESPFASSTRPAFSPPAVDEKMGKSTAGRAAPGHTAAKGRRHPPQG